MTTFTLKTEVLLDEVRAGGRIPLIIGRSLTAKARESLKLAPSEVFRQPAAPAPSTAGFTLAQKMVGKACGVAGIRPGQYCEPKISTVGSQDTTGGMTRDELTDLACLTFSADLVMQSFATPLRIQSRWMFGCMKRCRSLSPTVTGWRSNRVTVLSTLVKPHAAAGYGRHRC